MEEKGYTWIQVGNGFYGFPKEEAFRIKVEGSNENFSEAFYDSKSRDSINMIRTHIRDANQLEKLTDLYCDSISSEPLRMSNH